MALGIGEGSETNLPLARAVIGGLTVSTVFTLFLVPALYTALERFSKRSHAPEDEGGAAGGRACVSCRSLGASCGGLTASRVALARAGDPRAPRRRRRREGHARRRRQARAASATRRWRSRCRRSSAPTR